MTPTVRPATPADHARLIDIAADGDFGSCDSRYLSFIAENGRLLCATDGDEVIAYGGMVLIDQAAMITDLFVAPSMRGSGIGGRLLTALVEGHPLRMTFSAQHPAAQAAYRRLGMRPRGRMLYLSGAAIGGGDPMRRAPWTHGRKNLVDYFEARGATTTMNAIAQVSPDEVEVLRIESANAIDECQLLLRAFDRGTIVRVYGPESHALAPWLIAHGFTETDHDLLFATGGVSLPPTLAVLHPGLA